MFKLTNFRIIVLALIISNVSFGNIFAREIFVPVDNYPPFHIFPKNDSEPYGEVITVLKAIVNRVNKKGHFDLQLNFSEDLPFKRCLKLMRDGEAQLIGGLYDKGDRKNYMHLIKYKLNSNKVFIIRKNWHKDIKTFEELNNKNVGTVNGFKYFKEFDKNDLIFKDGARTFTHSLRKLENNRFDVIIAAENEWLLLKSTKPGITKDFKLATYKFDEPNPVYIGISKSSWLYEKKYRSVFDAVIYKMLKKQEFTKIIVGFYESYSQKPTLN